MEYSRIAYFTKVEIQSRTSRAEVLDSWFGQSGRTMSVFNFFSRTVSDFVFWIERCPFSFFFTLPDFVWLSSILFDYTGHCSTLFDFIWLCSTLPDIVRLCLTLSNTFCFYRELALLVRRQRLLPNWNYHMVFIEALDKFNSWWGLTRSMSRTYVANIATQNVYLATIATEIGYAATIVTHNGYVATLRDRRNFMRLCATQTRYVATLLDPNKLCCDHCDSWWVCCDFVRPKYLRGFARHSTDMLRLCALGLCVKIQPCSSLFDNNSTLFDSWFDSWFDPVRLMIRSCSTHDSTLFDSWFDRVRLMIRPCSFHDSTLFDYSHHLIVLICDENWTPFDRVGRIMSRTPQPGIKMKNSSKI